MNRCNSDAKTWNSEQAQWGQGTKGTSKHSVWSPEHQSPNSHAHFLLPPTQSNSESSGLANHYRMLLKNADNHLPPCAVCLHVCIHVCMCEGTCVSSAHVFEEQRLILHVTSITIYRGKVSHWIWSCPNPQVQLRLASQLAQAIPSTTHRDHNHADILTLFPHGFWRSNPTSSHSYHKCFIYIMFPFLSVCLAVEERKPERWLK